MKTARFRLRNGIDLFTEALAIDGNSAMAEAWGVVPFKSTGVDGELIEGVAVDWNIVGEDVDLVVLFSERDAGPWAEKIDAQESE